LRPLIVERHVRAPPIRQSGGIRAHLPLTRAIGLDGPGDRLEWRDKHDLEILWKGVTRLSKGAMNRQPGERAWPLGSENPVDGETGVRLISWGVLVEIVMAQRAGHEEPVANAYPLDAVYAEPALVQPRLLRRIPAARPLKERRVHTVLQALDANGGSQAHPAGDP